MMVLYFAYGSNMLTKQLVKRIPSAKPHGIAVLSDWSINFSKKSSDGSGKANLIFKPGSVVWGVLYQIDDGEIEKLDNFEKGYNRIRVSVKKEDGEILEADTYISKELIDYPVAFDTYKSKIINGAIEHDLPQEYIQILQQLPSRSKNM